LKLEEEKMWEAVPVALKMGTSDVAMEEFVVPLK
jgi:hypothetical protein